MVNRKRQEKIDRYAADAVAKVIPGAVDRAMADAGPIIAARATAENDAKWRAWLERREEAEARNVPFDEPPPG